MDEYGSNNTNLAHPASLPRGSYFCRIMRLMFEQRVESPDRHG